MWRVECVVCNHVLKATGLTVGGWASGVVWERGWDTTGWSMGVDCTLGACGVVWLAVLGALGDGCVTSRRSIDLFLFITGGGASLDVGLAWTGLVVGDRTPLQVLMAP